MICEKCIHNAVCKYGEARNNGLYCTGEKCKQFRSESDTVSKIFEGVKKLIVQYRKGNISEYRLFIKLEELQQKCESEGADDD